MHRSVVGWRRRAMKKKKRSYTVYFAGGLFSLKHLIGNAWLAEAIYEKSHGKYRCLLPQDFVWRGRGARAIRDGNIRALVACDLALFNYDGADLDAGTVVEFMFAKFADIPAVLLRTDLRNAGDWRSEPWNLMTSGFPRPAQIPPRRALPLARPAARPARQRKGAAPRIRALPRTQGGARFTLKIGKAKNRKSGKRHLNKSYAGF